MEVPLCFIFPRAVASEDSCSTCGISPPLHSPPPSSSPPVKENGNTLKKCSRCKKVKL